MSQKILWFDTETTGLDPNRNAMIQIAMLMDIDGELVDEIKINIQPFETDIVQHMTNYKSQESDWANLKILTEKNGYGQDDYVPVSGIMFKELCKYLDPLNIIIQINVFLQKHISRYDKTDKAYIGGYNIGFDIAFLSKFYEKCGDNYLGSYINWKQLDIRHMLYMLDFDGQIKLEKYNLETACKHFGIELEAHNPLSDIKATRELFYILRKGDINA